MLSCPERHSRFEPSDYTKAAVDARVTIADSEAVSRWFSELIREVSSALADYFDPDPQPGEGWSGGWFERLDPDADPSSFLESDLLSLNLLEVRMPGRMVRDLVRQGPFRAEAERLLGLIKDIPLWDPEAEEELQRADRLWGLLRLHSVDCLKAAERVRDTKLSSCSPGNGRSSFR